MKEQATEMGSLFFCKHASLSKLASLFITDIS